MQPMLRALKIAVPLALGIWLVVHFYLQLDPQQRQQVFSAFAQADPIWVLVACIVGWFSHVVRAWRWRYLLEPLGHRPGFWNCYHAVMIGYFMNLLIPRAGEVSRGVSLSRTDGVPFEKGFGSILAERAVDVLLMLIIATLALLMQVDKWALFRSRIAEFRSSTGGSSSALLSWSIVACAALVVMAAAYFLIARRDLRAKALDKLRGLGEGFRSVLRLRQRWSFVLHSCLIWVLYVVMFRIGFFALPATADVPLAGVFAGFIAGTIGIMLVQGGLGVYPAFVAVIVSLYMLPAVSAGAPRPEALALGWLLWVIQTAMLVLLGGLSLLLARRQQQSQ